MLAFSIIVPVYKAEKTLERCVRSLCAQTIRDIEIILVDDGNTDRSGVMCDEWKKRDSRIHVIHQKNAGPSAARNAGLAIAQGEWITFCDADDEMLPQACEKYLRCADKYGADIVIADIYRREGEKRQHVRLFQSEVCWEKSQDIDALIATTMCYQMNPWPNGTYARFGYGGPWNKAIRARILTEHQIAFPEEIRQYEDRLFNMLAYRESRRIAYLPEPLYVYYAMNQSITHAQAKDIFALNDRIFARFKAFSDEQASVRCEQAMQMLICERMLFALQNITLGRNSIHDLILSSKQIGAQCKQPIYAQALKRSEISKVKKADAVVLFMLKHHLVFGACLVCSLKHWLKG